MSHWRSNCLQFMMYCGGFSDRHLYLAPSGAQDTHRACQDGAFANVIVDTQAWTERLRGGIDHVKSFAEDKRSAAATDSVTNGAERK